MKKVFIVLCAVLLAAATGITVFAADAGGGGRLRDALKEKHPILAAKLERAAARAEIIREKVQEKRDGFIAGLTDEEEAELNQLKEQVVALREKRQDLMERAKAARQAGDKAAFEPLGAELLAIREEARAVAAKIREFLAGKGIGTGAPKAAKVRENVVRQAVAVNRIKNAICRQQSLKQ